MPASPPAVTINLQLTASDVDPRANLLQRGFLIPVTKSISIARLLSTLPGFTQDYIDTQVQTIFVNGLAEDNTKRQLVADNTLALSAAMPGLAGAIFRKGGQHASLRTRPVTTECTEKESTGFITLKLFNIIAITTGPGILEQGILIRGKVLARYLDSQKNRLLPLLERITHNNRSASREELYAACRHHNIIFLRLKA